MRMVSPLGVYGLGILRTSEGLKPFSKFRRVNWCILRNARHGVIRATESSSKAP